MKSPRKDVPNSSNLTASCVAATVWTLLMLGIIAGPPTTPGPDSFAIAQSENQPSRPMLYRVASLER